MGRPNKIEGSGLGGVVMGYVSQGMSCRDIAKKLTEEHGFSITHTAVYKYIATEKKLRASARADVEREIAQMEGAARLQVAGSMVSEIPRDLNCINTARDCLFTVVTTGYMEYRDPEDGTVKQEMVQPKDRIGAASALAKVVATRVQLTGGKELDPSTKKDLTALLGGHIKEVSLQIFGELGTPRTERLSRMIGGVEIVQDVPSPSPTSPTSSPPVPLTSAGHAGRSSRVGVVAKVIMQDESV